MILLVFSFKLREYDHVYGILLLKLQMIFGGIFPFLMRI